MSTPLPSFLFRVLLKDVKMSPQPPHQIEDFQHAILCDSTTGRALKARKVLWLWCGHFIPFAHGPPDGAIWCNDDPASIGYRPCFRGEWTGRYYAYCRACQSYEWIITALCGACCVPMRIGLEKCPCSWYHRFCRAAVSKETQHRRQLRGYADPVLNKCTYRAVLNNGGYCRMHLSHTTFQRRVRDELKNSALGQVVPRIANMASVFERKKRARTH